MLRENCGAFRMVLENSLEPDPCPALHYVEPPGETELMAGNFPLLMAQSHPWPFPAGKAPAVLWGHPCLGAALGLGGPPQQPGLASPMGSGGVPWVSVWKGSCWKSSCSSSLCRFAAFEQDHEASSLDAMTNNRHKDSLAESVIIASCIENDLNHYS